MLPGSYETDIESKKAIMFTSDPQRSGEKKSAKAITKAHLVVGMPWDPDWGEYSGEKR